MNTAEIRVVIDHHRRPAIIFGHDDEEKASIRNDFGEVITNGNNGPPVIKTGTVHLVARTIDLGIISIITISKWELDHYWLPVTNKTTGEPYPPLAVARRWLKAHPQLIKVAAAKKLKKIIEQIKSQPTINLKKEWKIQPRRTNMQRIIQPRKVG